MSQPDAPPIEVARVREVVGIADSRDAFDRIVEALLLAGVDRARISLMGSRERRSWTSCTTTMSSPPR